MHLIELYSEQKKYGNLVQKLICKRLIKLIFYEFYPASWSGSRYRVMFEEKRCWCFPKLYFNGFLSHCVKGCPPGHEKFCRRWCTSTFFDTSANWISHWPKWQHTHSTQLQHCSTYMHMGSNLRLLILWQHYMMKLVITIFFF